MHELNNFHILGNLWGVFVTRAESEREILWYGRVLAVLLLLRRHEDLQLAGGQQLHPQGQPQLPHHRVRYVEDCKMWDSCGNYFCLQDHDGFGLWIDEELLHGRSQPVQTFKSPSLSSEKDFHINNLELWTFK